MDINKVIMIGRLTERFRNVKGYDGLYQVSNLGRVKSLKRKKEVIMTNFLNPFGYNQVKLSRNGKNKTVRVHRLVGLAFINNPKDKPEINHINGIKNDNRIENLEWVTPTENARHAWKNNLITSKKGEQHGMAKLTWNNVDTIRTIYKTGIYSHRQLAKKFSVSKTNIGDILRNKIWVRR